MSDFCDLASEQQEYLLDVALSKHHNKKRLTPTGRCLNCSERIDKGCFCDNDCREDYEKRERFKSGGQEGYTHDQDDD